MPLLQEKNSKKANLFGLRSLNQLIANESSHDLIIEQGTPANLCRSKRIIQGLTEGAGQPKESEESVEKKEQKAEEDRNLSRMNKEIE